MTRATATAGIALLLLCSMAGAAAANPSRAEVERRLGGIDAQASPDALRRLGPGVDAVLIAIATDPAAPPLRRVRALHALGSVPSVAGRELLRATLRRGRTATTAPAVYEAAAAARALGRFGGEAVGDLVPLLTHPSAEVRAGAALGLGATASGLARTALLARLGVESDAGARWAIETALRDLATTIPR